MGINSVFLRYKIDSIPALDCHAFSNLSVCLLCYCFVRPLIITLSLKGFFMGPTEGPVSWVGPTEGAQSLCPAGQTTAPRRPGTDGGSWALSSTQSASLETSAMFVIWFLITLPSDRRLCPAGQTTAPRRPGTEQQLTTFVCLTTWREGGLLVHLPTQQLSTCNLLCLFGLHLCIY